MEFKEEKKAVLNQIFDQQRSFDNKASILVSVTGIIFAISLSFLEVFNELWFKAKDKGYQIGYSCLFGLFVLFMVASLVLFILVILPRKHKKSDGPYANYYMDIPDTNDDSLDFENSLKEFVSSDKQLIDQIKINARICRLKHKLLFSGICLLAPAVLLAIGLIVMIII